MRKNLVLLDVKKITQSRRERRFTLPELAKEAELSYLTLLNSLGQKHGRVTEKTAMKIADALGMSVAEVILDDEPAENMPA